MIPALVDFLARSYQAGDMVRMEAIARSMLAAIPDDIVAIQFLGLALYQAGHIDKAYQMFKRAAAGSDSSMAVQGATVCEPASIVSYREATRAFSGLADAWYRIALVLKRFGLHQPASRALEASATARGATATNGASS